MRAKQADAQMMGGVGNRDDPRRNPGKMGNTAARNGGTPCCTPGYGKGTAKGSRRPPKSGGADGKPQSYR